MLRHVGWYDNSDQDTPARWPEASAACPLCGSELGPRGLQRDDGKSRLVATSVMRPGADRSYFYFLHRDCLDGATPDQISDIESAIIDGSH